MHRSQKPQKEKRPIDLCKDQERITSAMTEQVRYAQSEKGWRLDYSDPKTKSGPAYIVPPSSSEAVINKWAAVYHRYVLPVGDNNSLIVVLVPHWFWKLCGTSSIII